MGLFDCSSNWMIALGNTLVHSLWIGILFLSILKILFIFIPRRFASHRYLAALAVLVIFTGTIAAIFSWLYSPHVGNELVATGTAIKLHGIIGLQDDNELTRAVYYYSTCIYFSGIVFYLVYMIISIGHIHVLGKGAKQVRGSLLERFNSLKERVGIGTRTNLLFSDHTDTPLLAGFIKPVVIIPTGMLTQLPFSQVEAILMHELFHLKRFDHLINLFQRIIEMIFFYNPAIWRISRIIRNERENCCDDLVLSEFTQPLDYARALYQLAKEQGHSMNLFPAATGNNKGELKNRIQRILNPTTMKTNVREKISALILLAAGFLIVAVITGFTSGISITQNNQGPEELPLPSPSLIPQVKPLPSPLPALPDTIPVPDEVSPCEKAIDREEIEAAKLKAMEEIDWEQIKEDIEQARQLAMEEIDWEQIKEDIEQARQLAMEEIDWEKIREDIDKAMEAIDWEEIGNNMEKMKIQMDSLMHNFSFDTDFDFEEETEN